MDPFLQSHWKGASEWKAYRWRLGRPGSDFSLSAPTVTQRRYSKGKRYCFPSPYDSGSGPTLTFIGDKAGFGPLDSSTVAALQ